MPRTKITKTNYKGSDGHERTQYRTTIPKQIAETFDMGDAELEWIFRPPNALSRDFVD